MDDFDGWFEEEFDGGRLRGLSKEMYDGGSPMRVGPFLRPSAWRDRP